MQLAIVGTLKVELPDDRIRKTREITKCTKERFVPNRSDLIELYLKGQMGIAIRCIDPRRPYYGIILESGPYRHKFQPRLEFGGRSGNCPRRDANLYKAP